MKLASVASPIEGEPMQRLVEWIRRHDCHVRISSGVSSYVVKGAETAKCLAVVW